MIRRGNGALCVYIPGAQSVRLAAANTDSRQQGLEPGMATQWIEIGVDSQVQGFCAPLINGLFQPCQGTVRIAKGKRQECEDDRRDVRPSRKRHKFVDLS